MCNNPLGNTVGKVIYIPKHEAYTSVFLGVDGINLNTCYNIRCYPNQEISVENSVQIINENQDSIQGEQLIFIELVNCEQYCIKYFPSCWALSPNCFMLEERMGTLYLH